MFTILISKIIIVYIFLFHLARRICVKLVSQLCLQSKAK